MDEIFLEDGETGLWVSNLGRVIGKTGKIVHGCVVKSGHVKIACGNNKFVFAHRLVARNFLPNPLNLPFINHKDENPINNRVDNLEWCTSYYNNNYGTAISRHKQTLVRHGKTVHCVLFKDGIKYEAASYVEMSKITGVSESCVYAIIHGKVTHSHGFHLSDVIPSGRNEPEAKPLTITDGKDTKSFPSQIEAAKFLHSHSSKVSKMAQGKRFSVHGWHIVGRIPNRRPAFRGVLELIKGSERLKFDAISKAADYLSVGHTSISHLISGKSHSCKGWRLAE